MADLTKIVLNPGHVNDDDRGFLGPETEDGNNEKTCVAIKEHLDKNYIVDVVIVDQDDGTPFEKLGSKHPDATLFYSHHTNAYKGIGKGTEVFYAGGQVLARNIAKATAVILETMTRGGDDGAKPNTGVYAVINQAQKAGVKYALLGEIGFHDNVKENQLIVDRRGKIAVAIAEEMAKFLKLERKKTVEDKKLDVAQQWAVDNGIAADRNWEGPISKSTLVWVLFDFWKKFIKK